MRAFSIESGRFKALFQFPSTVVVSAFAKINLGLHVLRKRADGFHDLETVFLRVGWADRMTFEMDGASGSAEDSLTSAVTIEASDGVDAVGLVSMTCSDPSLPTDERNLCVRAVRLLADRTGLVNPPRLRIHLDKRVPHGAGLGGGSSDAATCLREAARLWQLEVADEDLMDLAADLGSDVPFFFGEATAFGSGRGEILDGIPFPAALQDRWIAVVVPDFGISTAEAYGGIAPNDADRPDLTRLMVEGDLTDWKKDLVIDFERHLFVAYPALAELKSHLYARGAGYAAMSGSGSAIFGIFDSEEGARRAVEGTGMRYWMGPAQAAL